MFDAKKTIGDGWSKKVQSAYFERRTAVLRRVRSRELAFANRLARHNIEQILSGSFTAPKLQLVALLSGILFCLFNIIERYERYEDNRSAEFKHSWP